MVVETIIDWAIPEKNRGLTIWNFQGYWRNGKWIFQGLIKNNEEFSGVLILGLKISKEWKNYLWSFLGWSLVLSGISKGEVKKTRNSRGVFKKVMSSSPLVCFFSWNFPNTFYVWIDYFHNLCENFASTWVYSRN